MSTTPDDDKPTDESAAPGAPQPPSGYGAPQPGYQQQPGYQAPPGYQQAPGYQAPPPGYQAPPPGYQVPPPGYGPAPAAPPSLWSLALSDGWKAFGRVAGPFVGALVLWVVIGVAVMAVVGLVFGGWDRIFDPDGRGVRGLAALGFSFAAFGLTVVGAFVLAFIQAAFVRNALEVARGRRPAFADFFRFTDVGPVAVLALLIAGIHVVAGLVTWLPGVGQLVEAAIGYFLMFAYYFLLDRKLSPVDSIRASVQMVTRNLATTLVFFLLSVLIVGAGFLACGVGFFVAAPVVLLATAYLYRRLQGEQPVLPT